jgi:twitching motility protein PilU
LRQTMAEDHGTGMQTFDDALYGLFQRGMISMETCLDAAESPSEVRMRMRAFSPVGRSAG